MQHEALSYHTHTDTRMCIACVSRVWRGAIYVRSRARVEIKSPRITQSTATPSTVYNRATCA